ncbi:hypothetical Protein pso3_04540 [Candidatus Phytoplasma solani]
MKKRVLFHESLDRAIISLLGLGSLENLHTVVGSLLTSFVL